jgi:hypothetical protein
MRETIASRAILIFCTDPRIWIWLTGAWSDTPGNGDAFRKENLRIGQNDTCTTGILNRKLGLSILTRNSTDSSR